MQLHTDTDMKLKHSLPYKNYFILNRQKQNIDLFKKVHH